MDERRFDDLTRAFASSSRRTLLRRLLGGAAAAGATAGISLTGRDGGVDAAPIGCKASGKRCTKAGQCCRGLVCAGQMCVAPTPTPDPCPEPGAGSTYDATCYNESLTCGPEGNILSADCEDALGDPSQTSINVNSCAAQNYVIANCNATLTCGGCTSS